SIVRSRTPFTVYVKSRLSAPGGSTRLWLPLFLLQADMESIAPRKTRVRIRGMPGFIENKGKGFFPFGNIPKDKRKTGNFPRGKNPVSKNRAGQSVYWGFSSPSVSSDWLA